VCPVFVEIDCFGHYVALLQKFGVVLGSAVFRDVVIVLLDEICAVISSKSSITLSLRAF